MNISEPLGSSLGFVVNGLARLMRSALEARLKDFSLTPTSWTVLMALAEAANDESCGDALSQTDLARRTFLDGATITRTLDLLETKQYIVRNRDDDDRRIQMVALTDDGREMTEKTAGLGEDVNAYAMGDLYPVQQKELLLLISMVTRRLTEDNSGGDSNG